MVDTIKMRKPNFAAGRTNPSGRVAHDDRGNAVWQWGKDDPLRAALESSGLSLADEEPPASPLVTLKRVNAVKGYNPYESGLLDKPQAPPRKRNLRELSKWIEQQNAEPKNPKP